MNIAITTYSLPPYDSIGAGVQNHYLANEFVRRGHRVTVFSPHVSPPADALYEHVAVTVVGRLKTLKWSVALSKVDFSTFDYLHCTGDDHFVKTAVSTCHLRQYHGCSFGEFRHARTSSAKLRNLLLYATELGSGIRADVLTCVSARSARALPKRTSIVPCGVDLTSFTPGGVKSENPTILFVGTLESRKRGDLLVAEFSSNIIKRFPNAVLNIVRETNPVKHKNVFVHGFVNLQSLIDLYRSSWAFCLPSTYEGFGVPYIEAMSCGTAVVATPNDGSIEVLDNGKFGLLCTTNNLGDSISSLLADKNRLRSLEAAGLARSKDYGWSNIISKYLCLVNRYHE